MTQALAGQAGIITGGGSGIGAATALALAQHGAKLIVADISAQAAKTVVSQIRTAQGEAVALTADVRRIQHMERLRDACLKRFGRLDFLIANAGLGDTSSLATGDPERWRKIVETNLLGTAYAVRAVLPTMQAQKSGHLILVASVSGRESYVGEPVYIASKWAVVGLGHALRKEALKYGVRVTLIEPGLVDTPMARANPFAVAWMQDIEPLQPSDIANAILYALAQPPYMAVNELVLRPIVQEV